MDPVTLGLIITGLEFAVKETPTIVAEFQTLFASGNPTPADFAALRAKVLGESYKQFVPQTSLSETELG